MGSITSTTPTAQEPKRGLARRYYFDQEVFDEEMEKIFLKTWQCVGHVSEFPTSRCYKVFNIAGESILVIRQDDDSFQAFHNHCVHRGHPLLSGSGTLRTVTCPYHGWSYNVDGTLRLAPHAKQCAAFSCLETKPRLKSVQLDVFLGFVFVNCDAEAPALSAWLGEEEALLRSFLPEIESSQFVCETGLRHQANWKVSVENYNECYHCPIVHATSLARGVLDIKEGYSLRSQGATIFQEGVANTKHEKQYDYDTQQGGRGDRAGSWFFFPNFSLVSYPGGFLSVRQWFPESIGETTYLYRWFAGPGMAEDEVRKLMNAHATTTGAEDGAITAEVYRGMKSRFYEPGYLVTDDENRSSISDSGVAYLQDLYRSAMGIV